MQADERETDFRRMCSFCSEHKVRYPGPRCRDCCDDEVLFLYTAQEMESKNMDPIRVISDGAPASADDLREVAIELLTRLQKRAQAAGTHIQLTTLASKILESRSCNLKAELTSRPPRPRTGKDRPGRTVPVRCHECGRATKLRLTTGELNRHQDDQKQWCVAAGAAISTPRTDPDAYPPMPVHPPAVRGRIIRVDPDPATAPTIPLTHRTMGLPARSWLRFG